MDLETRRFGLSEPMCGFSPYSNPITEEELSITDLESDLIRAIVEDDKEEFVKLIKRLFTDFLDDHHRTTVSKLLHYCCGFDSVNCATSLVNGEIGAVAVVNEVDDYTGMSAIHVAAEAHAACCVELLLKRRARTDVRSKDGWGLLALELSLSCDRMDVVWNPDDYSSEDLVVMLGEKNLTTVKLLSEKTKEINEVAYANAMEGRVVALAALLIVAAERVKESVMVLHDAELGFKGKATIYECVIREALSLGRATPTTQSRMVKRSCTLSKSESAMKRRLLLCEIELLQLFGAAAGGGAAHSDCTEKKVTSPLILATQAGDETVIELLLKSDMDVNDADSEGNAALHYSLKTSMKSSDQQIQIISLLLKHGAQVSQKNKLGLTAVHIATASGNARALEVLLVEDPDCINSKTIMDETPLFYAVKNDHMNCAELLLRWGVKSEVLNLRRERPIDLAKSQDMRFLLNPAQISHLNRAFPISQKSTASQEGDELSPETVQTLLSMADEGTNTDQRMCSSTKAVLCKYFGSPSGCIRGTKCFYAHGEEELRKNKQEMQLIHSPNLEDLRRKIFIGGLPLSVDSDSLRGFFEEHFGSVEDAKVVRVQSEKQIQSRGFGFITFQHEESVLAATKVRHVTLMGKKVEIRSAIPKYIVFAEIQKQSAQKQVEQYNQSQPLAPTISEKIKDTAGQDVKQETPTGKTTKELQCARTTEEITPNQMSWANRLLLVQPDIDYGESQTLTRTSNVSQKIPKWLSTFIKWLPRFLKDTYDHMTEGEYALSSLKTDFKAAFGLELNHASLGYSKLSEFLRSFPDLCSVKAGSLNKFGSPNHMVLLPSLSTSPKWRALQRDHNSVDDFRDGDFNNIDIIKENHPVSDKYASFISRTNGEMPKHKNAQDWQARKNKFDVPESFLEFCRPDTVFRVTHGNNGGEEDPSDGTHQVGPNEMNPRPRLRHLVLEALARQRRNTSVFFLREYDFHDKYEESVKRKKCFWCNQHKILWKNSPCDHKLWCGKCKEEAIRAAGNSEHKCVICDVKVRPIMILSSIEEFPPLRLFDNSRKKRP